MASLRRTGEDGSLCGSRSLRQTTLTFLSVDPPSYRYFRHGNKTESCAKRIDSLSRTRSGGRNHSARKTLSGAIAITPENLAKSCAELASNKKAEDIVILDLRGISSFTDFFVICSGTSEPERKEMANEIHTRLREDYSLRPKTVDEYPANQ